MKIVQAAVEEGARVDSLFLASNQLSFTDLFTVLDPLLGPALELGSENNYIVNLDISFNRLAWEGGEKLQLLISSLLHLERLDARGNEIKGSVLLSLHQKKERGSDDDEEEDEKIAYSSNNLGTLLLSRNEITIFSLAAPHSNIEHLDLDHNELGRISILDVASVAHLNVSSNQLYAIPPCIRRLANLKTLDLSQNLITSVTSACLPDREKGLRHLDLSYNNITLLDPSCLDFFYSLKSLFLQGNQTLDGLPDFSDLISLTVLDVSETAITTLPQSLCKLALLSHFYAGNADRFTHPPPSIVKEGLAAIVKYLMSF